MLLFTILDNTFCTFIGDNYKYLGLLLNFSDSELSFFFFCSPFIVMLSNYFCGWSYNKFGL